MVPETDLEIALSALTLPVAQHADRNSEKFTLGEGEATDPNHITFAEPFDATNPIHWTIRKKWMVTGVMSATAFIRITSSTIMAPALGPIAQDLHMSSLEAQMALSVYLLASAFGPLVLSPLSELYGRKPVLHASNIWFLVWNLACGFAETKGVLIAARGFAGFGGSVAYALGSAVLGDIWLPEERGRSLGIYWVIPLLGAAIGPTIGGYITQYASWPWVFWSLSVGQAVLVLMTLFMFQESHKATILHKRAIHFRKTTGNSALFTMQERLDAGQTSPQVLLSHLTRPLRLLCFHPIIQFVSVLEAFSYGLLYLAISSYATLWIQQYGESIATSGLHYFALAIGEVIGAEVGGAAMDWTYRKLKERHNGRVSPEYRAPLMLPGLVLVPIGLLIYGWTANAHAPWPAVDAGMLVFSLGLQMQGQPLTLYIIEAYPDHTASASAASQLLKSLAAFGFPLAAPSLYEALGYGWGNSTLAIVSAVLFTLAPALLWVYGPRLRAMAMVSH